MKTRSQTFESRTKKASLRITRPKQSEKLMLRSEKSPSRSETQQKGTKISGKTNDSKIIAECNSDFEVFIVGDIVWGKMRGHPHWPAKVLLF